jgi:uncharacterized repeat protein (TIGR01451 family)
MLRSWVSRSILIAMFTTAGACGALGWAERASAQACTPPTIDGNIGDLISYAACVTGCGIDHSFPAQDVCFTSVSIIPCATTIPCPAGGGKYFQNGFDLTRTVLAYDSVNHVLYLGYRVAGVIGDGDGDGTAGAGVGCPSIPDPAGIGAGENYEWFIDTNCDGTAELDVTASGPVGGVVVKVNGSTVPGATGAYAATGSDLEIMIPDVNLPPIFQVFGTIGSSFDGLGEDTWQPLSCANPDLHITINKTASPSVLCPNATTSVTLTIANTSNVPLANVVVTDALPAHLAFVAASSGGTCTLGQPTITGVPATGQTLTWPAAGTFNMAVGQTCTITFQAQRIDQLCVGNVVNHSSVVGSFQSRCFNGGEPVGVGPATFDFTFNCTAPNVTLDPAGPFCSDLAPVQLNGQPAGGTYSGDGVNPTTGVFSPVAAGLGPHTITYTYSDPATQCSGTASIVITVQTCELGCWLTAGGAKIADRKGQPIHSWGGNVYPGCSSTAGDGGNWDHIAHLLNLHFQGTHIEVIKCGLIPGIPPSSSPDTPNNYIEFKGTGRLFGVGGNNTNYPLVYFFAHCEDRQEPGSHGQPDPTLVDRYMLNVYTDPNDPVGSSKLLVNGNANPLVVDPLPITDGNMQLHIIPCEQATTLLPIGPVLRGPKRPLSLGADVAEGGADAAEVTPGSIQPVPNPFGDRTRIDYDVVAEGADVEIGIFDVAGRKVRSLVFGHMEAGQYSVTWDGRDDQGLSVTHGMYFVRAAVGRQTVVTKRVLYLK